MPDNDNEHGWVTMTLPSRGEFYTPKVLRAIGWMKPDADPGVGEDDSLVPGGQMQVRTLGFKEETVLNTQGMGALDRLNRIITTASKTPTVGRASLPHGQLLVTDRLAILLTMRVLTFGRKYAFTYSCACKALNKKELDIQTDLDETTPETVRDQMLLAHVDSEAIGEPPPLTEPFDCFLPVVKKTVQLRFLRGDDEAEIFKAANKKRMQSSDPDDPSHGIRLAKQIVSVEGEKLTPVKTELFVRMLKMEDTAAIRIETDRRETGVDVEVTPTCSNCGRVNEMTMPFDVEFFRPSKVRS